MRVKLFLSAMLLLCGLAQTQEPQAQWPQGFYKDDFMPMLLAEPMRHETGEELPVLSQVFKSEMQPQQTANAPQRVWVVHYKRKVGCIPIDIAVDVVGDVFVTGTTRGVFYNDFLTLKYNSAGIKQWEAIYDGPGGGRELSNSDYAVKIVADFNDNLYVAGSSEYGSSHAYVTLKYDKSSGDTLWTNHYPGYGIDYGEGDFAHDFVVDHEGNVYVTGHSKKFRKGGHSRKTDYATVKYDKTGIKQWAAHYPVTWEGGDMAIALDPAGNICITGSGYYYKDAAFFTTIKYSPTGKTQWVANYKPYKESGLSWNHTRALAIDAAGNVYVAGFSYYTASLGRRLTIVKYNSAGVQQWAVSNIENRFQDNRQDLKMWVDQFENIYLSGAGLDLYKYVVIKYNKAGELQWISRYQEPKGTATVNDMIVDASGNVYVTGICKNSSHDLVTIKFNTAGAIQWTVRFNVLKPSTYITHGALALDGSGNVYVIGQSGSHIVIIKYSQGSFSASSTPNVLSNRENEKMGTAAAPEITLPENFYLAPNYPNPFGSGAPSRFAGNPGTTIRFGLPQASQVTLKVYNVLSAEVATLVEAQKPAGVHAVDFAPKKDLPSGIYFCVLNAGSVRLVQRMVYAK